MVIAERARGAPLALRQPARTEPALALTERTAGLLEALELAQDLAQVVGLNHEVGALRGLARAARLGLREQNEIAAARVKVQHRAGSLLIELATEHRPWRAKRARGKAPLRPKLPRGALKQYAITGQESSNWQALASVPITEVERRMAELVTAGQEITSAEFIRRGQVSMRTDRNSWLEASPAELRLRAALSNLARVRALSTTTEWHLARKIADCLRSWQRQVPVQRQMAPSRPDLERVTVTCLACGRDRASTLERRCVCGGSWTAVLR